MNHNSTRALAIGLLCVLILASATESAMAPPPVRASPPTTATMPIAADASLASASGLAEDETVHTRGPWSPFDLALTSGRLAQFTYGTEPASPGISHREAYR